MHCNMNGCQQGFDSHWGQLAHLTKLQSFIRKRNKTHAGMYTGGSITACACIPDIVQNTAEEIEAALT